MITLLFALLTSQAQGCTLTKPATLKIGCTVDCEESYKTALQNAAQANGYQIEIVTIGESGSAASALAQLDGFLSPGGHDIDPSFFTKKVSAAERARLTEMHSRLGNDGISEPRHLQRDRHEYKLMTEYFKNPRFNNMPLLGVCYGMQMMAAAHDVPLHVDITEQLGLPAQRRVNNQITFTSMDKGRLAALPNTFRAYKFHHQAVNAEAIAANPQLYRNLKVRAKSNDGKIAEIIETVDRPAVGVQFHSEARGQQDPKVAPALFGWFLRQACANRNFKTQSAPVAPAPRPAKPPIKPPEPPAEGGSTFMQ